MKISISKKYFPITFIFIVLLLQQALINYTSGVLATSISYVDEIVTVILSIRAMLYYRRNKLLKQERQLFFLVLLFLLIGILSNLVNPMQKMYLNMLDAFTCIKFVLLYLSVRINYQRYDESRKILNIIYKISKMLIVIFFTLSLLNIFIFDLFPRHDFRYFMYSIQLFFPHPTYLAVASLTCCMVVVSIKNMSSLYEDKYYIIASLTCVLFTMRTKAIAIVVLFVFIYIYYCWLKCKSKWPLVFVGSLLALYIGWDQIIYYFGQKAKLDDGFIRFRLLRDSIAIANSYFPFGSGFATFGSNAASTYFSPLYQAYGYAEGTRYLSDSFWPIVIAQTGWIGVTIFICILLKFAQVIFSLRKYKVNTFLAALMGYVYLLISSSSESAYFNPANCCIFILLGLFVNDSVMSNRN